MKLTVPKIDIRQRKTQLIIGISVGILLVVVMLVLVFTVMRESDKVAEEQPAIRVGETTLSKQKYDKLITQAKEQAVPEELAKSAIEDALYQQEAMRKLGVIVPQYLISAQKQVDETTPYIPYGQLSEYERVTLYPRAAFVAISLIQAGGSVATVYHAPYAEENRSYAEDFVNQVKQYKANNVSEDNGKQPNDPLRAILEVFTVNPTTHIAGVKNYSKVVALTNNGEEIVSKEEPFVSIDNLPVVKQPFDGSITAVIRDTKENSLSSTVKLPNANAYVVVHKDKLYTKDDTIMTRYQAVLEGVR